MSAQTAEEAFAAVGKAVANCQFLEWTFVVCTKLAYARQDVKVASEIEPLNKKTFKVPTMTLLQELRKHVEVSATFDATLTDVVERRHILVHRWQTEKRWPHSDDDRAAIRELTEFANKLSIDLDAVSRVLMVAISRWLKKFPQVAPDNDILSDAWLARVPTHL